MLHFLKLSNVFLMGHCDLLLIKALGIGRASVVEGCAANLVPSRPLWQWPQATHETSGIVFFFRQPYSQAVSIRVLSSGGTNGPSRIHTAYHFDLFTAVSTPFVVCSICSTLTSHVGERSAIVIRTVMIVDDNPAVRKALRELFMREEDFDVCGEAENGQEAIEKAQHLYPDLIVTDLSMPVMNGLEEARLLKKLMPAVPVIIYSAHADLFVEKEARSVGASAVMSKSEAVTVLIRKARSLLDKMAA